LVCSRMKDVKLFDIFIRALCVLFSGKVWGKVNFFSPM